MCDEFSVFEDHMFFEKKYFSPVSVSQKSRDSSSSFSKLCFRRVTGSLPRRRFQSCHVVFLVNTFIDYSTWEISALMYSLSYWKKKTRKKRNGIKIRVTVVEALKKRTFFPKLYFFLYNSVKSVKSAYLSLCKRAKFGLLNDFTHFGLTYPFSFSQNSRYFALFAHLYTNVCSFKKACFCVSSALKQPNTLMEVTVAEDFSFPFTRNVFFSKRCVFERLSFLNRF